MNTKTHQWFKCSALKGTITFWDGEVLPLPGKKDKAAREKILARCAEIKKPICTECGHTMTPLLTPNARGVAFHCTDCLARRNIRKAYSELATSELTNKLEEIAESAERRSAVVLELLKERRAEA